MSFRFKEFNRVELRFLANDVLRIDLEDSTKPKMLPVIINAIFKTFLSKNNNNEMFWEVIDQLAHFVKIVQSEDETIFRTLNIKMIEINHMIPRPTMISPASQPIGIDKNGVLCICPDSTIRKTHECYNCQRQSHRHCFIWQSSPFLCPICMMNYQDPFYKILYTIIPPSQLKAEKVFKFHISDEFMDKPNLHLTIRALRIFQGPDIQKFNDFECSFPQKGVVRLNGSLIHTFKPDKQGMPRRKDFPLNLSLSTGAKSKVQKGLNMLLFEIDNSFEYEHSSLIFSVSVAEYLSVSTSLERTIGEQFISEEANIEQNRLFIEKSFTELSECYEIKISLLDPLTYTRISFPVRGDSCTHANVFCYRNYLMNLEQSEQRRTKCPFCNKIILAFKFDFLVLKAIEEFYYISSKMTIVDDITFQTNGKYYFTADSNAVKEIEETPGGSVNSEQKAKPHAIIASDSEKEKDSISSESDQSFPKKNISDESDFYPEENFRDDFIQGIKSGIVPKKPKYGAVKELLRELNEKKNQEPKSVQPCTQQDLLFAEKLQNILPSETKSAYLKDAVCQMRVLISRFRIENVNQILQPALPPKSF